MSGVYVVRVPGGGLGILNARLAHRFGSVNTGVYLLIVVAMLRSWSRPCFASLRAELVSCRPRWRTVAAGTSTVPGAHTAGGQGAEGPGGTRQKHGGTGAGAGAGSVWSAGTTQRCNRPPTPPPPTALRRRSRRHRRSSGFRNWAVNCDGPALQITGCRATTDTPRSRSVSRASASCALPRTMLTLAV